MVRNLEVIDLVVLEQELAIAQQELMIEVEPAEPFADDTHGTTLTAFRVEPPLKDAEEDAIIGTEMLRSPLDKLMTGVSRATETATTYYNEGDTDESQVHLAFELAQGVIAQRKLHGAKVVATIGGMTHAYLVRPQAFETPPIVLI